MKGAPNGRPEKHKVHAEQRNPLARREPGNTGSPGPKGEVRDQEKQRCSVKKYRLCGSIEGGVVQLRPVPSRSNVQVSANEVKERPGQPQPKERIAEDAICASRSTRPRDD